MHECGSVCEYPNFITDNGNADECRYRGRNGRNVAGRYRSRTRSVAGWWNRNDIGGGAIRKRRRRDKMVAGIFT
jgi:hypothetical protein